MRRIDILVTSELDGGMAPFLHDQFEFVFHHWDELGQLPLIEGALWVFADWMLPGVSGIELCRRLRQRHETERLPVIMLTARGEESDRVRGLSTGADDYLVKPFSTPEFLARVRALLRRAKPEMLSGTLTVGDIVLDRETHRVYRAKREVKLGPTEFRLLEYLMQHPGRVFSRGQLLDNVWGETIYIDERTVDVHVGRLRKAVNNGRMPDVIRTIRGAGYAIKEA